MQDGLQAAQNILEWGWDQLQREPEQISQLNIVIKSALGILSSHIKEVYPAKGKKEHLFIILSVHSTTHPSILQLVHPFNYPSIYPSISPSIQLPIHLSFN